MKLKDMDLRIGHKADREKAVSGAFADKALLAAESIFSA